MDWDWEELLFKAGNLYQKCKIQKHVPHAILVLLNELLLLILVLHPVFAWYDKVRCDSTLWAGPDGEHIHLT